MVASKMFLNKVFSHVVVPDERLIQQAPGLASKSCTLNLCTLNPKTLNLKP